MSQSVMQIFSSFLLLLLLSSRSRSQWGLIWSNYDFFVYIFWSVDSLATRLGLMIHRPRPEYSVTKKKRLQHSGSRLHWKDIMLMFVQMISSKPPNILFPNLVLSCIIMSRSVMQKDWFAIFRVKVAARAHMIKIWQFLLYLLNCWPFCYQTWFASIYHKPECFYGEIGLLCSRSRSQQHFKMSMNVCLDIFWITEPFATKLGTVMHHHEPDCCSKRSVCGLQGQGHSEG